MSAIPQADAIRLLEDAFNAAPGSLRPDSTRDAIKGWDSMGALLLMAELDDRFGITLSPELSKTMTTVADVLAFMRAHGAVSD